MYLNTIKTKKLVTFRQWSRKSYAVFSSLKLLIKISVLSVAYSLLNPVQECKAQTDSVGVTKKIELDEVEITGQRTPVVASQATRIVTVISRSEVERAPAQSINELLENVSQVDIRQRGVNGIQADISIQGGSFDQTLILLNGINFTDPQTGHHNLNLPIDLSDIDRVEILKGPASRVYGPNAFAGAVNFVTGQNPNNLIKAGISSGQYGLYNGNFYFNQHSSRFQNSFSISKSGCDGYIQNTDYSMTNLYYKGNIMLDKNQLGIQLGYITKDFGANSFYSPKLPNQYESNQTYLGSLDGRFGGIIKLIPAIYWRRNYDHFIYDRTNVAMGANFHYTDIYGANFNATYSGILGKTSIGADYRREIIYSTNLGTPLSSEEQKNIPDEGGKKYTNGDQRDNISMFAEQTANLQNWNFSGGFMVNKNTDLNSVDIFPGLDLSYKFSEMHKLYLTTNRSLRLPTFTNLFYNSKSQLILGNADLKPETAWIMEAGIKSAGALINWNFTYFHKWGRKTIDYIWRDTIWHAENITKLNTDGVEASIQYIQDNGIIKQITLSYSLNLQSKASGELRSLYVLDQLKHKLVVTLSHRILKNLSGYWQASLQERNGYYDKWNNSNKSFTSTSYDPVLLFDGRVTWQKRFLKMYIEGSNLLNQDYIDIGNILQPGRWIKGGIEITIKY